MESRIMPFRTEAAAFARDLAARLPVNTVILDDWAGIRLIYETDDVANCGNNCAACPTHAILGGDPAMPPDDRLITSLTPASERHTSVKRNRMLNCKTKADYMESFIAWLAGRCASAAEIREELDLVFNFQVVYDRSCPDAAALEELARSMKRRIIDQAVSRTNPETADVIARYAALNFRN